MQFFFYKKGARSRDALKSILDGRYPKALQSDGYNVYLYLDDEVIDTVHLCCMAHARAKFFYAWQANREPDTEYILRIIQDLHDLEEHYGRLGLSPDEIKKMRNSDRTNELVIKLRSKIDSMKSAEHPPRSEMLEKSSDIGTTSGHSYSHTAMTDATPSTIRLPKGSCAPYRANARTPCSTAARRWQVSHLFVSVQV